MPDIVRMQIHSKLISLDFTMGPPRLQRGRYKSRHMLFSETSCRPKDKQRLVLDIHWGPGYFFSIHMV
jgi:hypothetical protein